MVAIIYMENSILNLFTNLLVSWNNKHTTGYYKEAKFAYNIFVIINLSFSSYLVMCAKLLNVIYIVIMCLYLCL